MHRCNFLSSVIIKRTLIIIKTEPSWLTRFPFSTAPIISYNREGKRRRLERWLSDDSVCRHRKIRTPEELTRARSDGSEKDYLGSAINCLNLRFFSHPPYVVRFRDTPFFTLRHFPPAPHFTHRRFAKHAHVRDGRARAKSPPL